MRNGRRWFMHVDLLPCIVSDKILLVDCIIFIYDMGRASSKQVGTGVSIDSLSAHCSCNIFFLIDYRHESRLSSEGNFKSLYAGLYWFYIFFIHYRYHIILHYTCNIYRVSCVKNIIRSDLLYFLPRDTSKRKKAFRLFVMIYEYK